MDSDYGAGTRKQIRTVLVGFGLSGRVFHAPFIRADPDFELVAIVTSSPTRQSSALTAHPEARVYSTYRELWESERDVDLVILSTPPDTHVDFAEQALSAGAAVVIDKPFVPTEKDALSLVSASAAAGRPIMVFHNRRWDGDFMTIRRLVESGELGDVFAFESSFEHWAPEATSGWKDQLPVADGGGVAYDLGSHLVDQALVLFGPAASVRSSLRTIRRGGGNDDHARIDLIHESGVESRLLMSRVSRGLGPRFRVLGTKGSYLSEDLDGQEPALEAGVRPGDPSYGVTPEASYGILEVEGSSGIVRRRVPTERGDYPEFYRRAALAIRGEGRVPVSADEAIAVIEVLEHAAAQMSRA
jgi:scyllo-inositol 2-dehydrogenase (NADP+)